MRFVDLVFRNSRGILATAVFLSILGAIALRQMPASILPDFPFPRLVIIADSGDMAIQDLIPRMTRPLESAASGVPGAKNVRSKTSRGAVEVNVDFEWGTDMFEAFTRLNANVSSLRSSFPQQASLLIEWVNPSSFPVIGYSVTSTKIGPRDLYDLANLNIAPTLSRLNGVYRVLVQGGQVREYQVVLDPSAISAMGITPEQVSAAVASSNLIQAVGRINRLNQTYHVLIDSQVRTEESLRDIPINRPGGGSVRVRDIATVREANEERENVVTADGREAVLLNVLKQPGASTAEVSREVKHSLDEMQRTLPEGVKITCFYDEADLLIESLGSLRDSIIVGAFLAFVVLIGFLRSWRTTLVVLLCLPITVFIAFLGLKLFHQTLNLMTLGGLAVGLGLIIDDVVVTLENIYRHAEMGKSPRQAAVDGAAEIQKPMIGSSITTMAVFVPLAFLSEITGALFSPLSITLALLLIVSMILAITVVPLVASRLLASGVHERPAERSGPISRVYEKALQRCLSVPAVVFGIAAGLAILAYGISATLPTGLMPTMDEGAFVLDYVAPAGTPLATTDRMVRRIERELQSTPEVLSYARRTGLEMGFFTTEPSRGDIMVKLKPPGQRKRAAMEVAEDVLARCQVAVPGYEMEVIPPIADRIADIAGEPSPVEVKIFGDDPETLDKLATEVKELLGKVPGTGESVHDIVNTGRELAIHIDPNRAGLAGVTASDVARTIEASLRGRNESSAMQGERIIGIRVVYPREQRRTLQDVEDMPIQSRSGKRIPLRSIASFSEIPGSPQVTRENQKPVTLVTASLHNRDLGSANREVKDRVLKEIKFPPGYVVQFGGMYQTQQQSFRSLMEVLLLGMLLVFIVTLFQYNRFAEPTALIIAAAFALAGVIFALKLTGTPLNASSGTGAIMIFGMVLTNGIVLMDTIRGYHHSGLGLSESIRRAGIQRIRPVFMTASIAILALLPLALGIGSGAEMQKPLAIAVIGGLAVSPFFTLLLAPVLLYTFRRGR